MYMSEDRMDVVQHCRVVQMRFMQVIVTAAAKPPGLSAEQLYEALRVIRLFAGHFYKVERAIQRFMADPDIDEAVKRLTAALHDVLREREDVLASLGLAVDDGDAADGDNVGDSYPRTDTKATR
jgi:hypothetical protein